MNDDSLGFAGMLAAGQTTPQAWRAIAESIKASPETQALLLGLAETAEGREMLRESRGAWLIRGLAPPWEPALGAIDEEPKGANDGT